MRTKEFEYATLEFDEDKNILFYRVKQDITVTPEVMKDLLRYVEEFMGPVRHYAVVDFGLNVNSTAEGRKKYTESEYIKKWRIADAFLVNSLGMRLIANFFIRMQSPAVPTRVFNDELLAILWLEKQKSEAKAAS